MDSVTALNGYTQEERDMLRERFRAWVAEHGEAGLRDSLRNLIYIHGYSPPEVAEWLGISRQWLSVLMSRFGIDPPAKPTRFRTWNGKRFEPDDRAPYEARLRAEAKAGREAQKLVYEERKQEGAALVGEMADELGRPPYVREVMDRLGYEPHQAPALAHRFGRTKDDRVAALLDEVWKRAGFRRPDGRVVSRKAKSA